MQMKICEKLFESVDYFYSVGFLSNHCRVGGGALWKLLPRSTDCARQLGHITRAGWVCDALFDAPHR